MFSVGLFPVIVFAYFRLARKEENEMLRIHGETCRDYQRRVRVLLPGRRQWEQLLSADWPGRESG